MHVYLTGRHVELTDAIRGHVDRHLIEPVERHTGVLRAVSMEVQLYKETDRGSRFGCHAQLDLPRHCSINIREEDNDLYAAIDLAQSRLVHALTDVKEKWITESRRPKKYSFGRLARALGWIRDNGIAE